MSLRRPFWIWAIALLLAVGFGIWISRSIEWVDIDVHTPPKEPLARDPFDIAKRLVRKLGGTVESPQNLERLPPAGATLVLSSRYWALFPARVQALERWVRDGGRLVIFQNGGGGRDEEQAAWLPVRSVRPGAKAGAGAAGAAAKSSGAEGGASAPANDDDDDDGDEDPPATTTPPPAAPKPAASDPDPDRGCERLAEPDAARAAYGARRDYRVCGYAMRRLRGKGLVTWALERRDGAVMMRAEHGKGSVTASALVSFVNANMLLHDGTLAFAAALSLRPGDVVWFVSDEKRQPFLAHLWASGSPAWLLAFVALALALWRGATRFGPTAREPSAARRSMAEQIRRTAVFVSNGGGASLHRAAVRALEEAARRWIPGYGALLAADDRGRAIGAATGLDGPALAAALAAGQAAAPAAGNSAEAEAGNAERAAGKRRLGAAIGLLEQARRRLLLTHTSPRAQP